MALSEPIGPGSILECIDAGPYEGRPVPLVLGARYVVKNVWDYLPHRGDPNSDWFDCAVDLVDVPDAAPGIAWGLHRFKPVSDGGLGIISAVREKIRELV